MSAFKISPKDMAWCQEIAAKAANEAATNALAEAIAEAMAVRQAEEEAEACQIVEAAAAKHAEDKAKATRRADANAMAASSFPEMDFPMATPEDLALPFSTLDTSTTPPSPISGEEDELIQETIPPKLDLSTVAAGKCKAAPKPPTTFAPASKHHKYFGGVDVIDSLGKVTPLPDSTTPSVAAIEPASVSASSYHLHDHSTTSAPASTSWYTRSPQAAIMDLAKAKASKSSKASKGSSKATGTKPVKHTPEEMPQLVSNKPINLELLTNNLLELIQHFGAHACTNCISQGQECVFRGFGLKCSACASVSTSHCTFSVPPPNTEFALSVAHCIGNSSILGLNYACHAQCR
ncbi:hypothetical protein BDQ17DRAFT_1426584 [Cyathus striatus]|nr:hypothetical protein BDQ17DRAFT_1426584 [Cyathus striatus]